MTRYPLIFWIVATIEALWGVCLLVSPATLGITAMLVIHSWVGEHHVLAGLITLTAVMLTAVRMGYGIGGRKGFLLVAPQAVLIIMTAIGCAYRAWIHQYADGVPRPFFFIAPDQVAYIVLASFHTYAWIVEHAEGRWTLRPRLR